MACLKDAYLGDVPAGILVFPSNVVRSEGGSGNYYLEDLMNFAEDPDIFPAVVVSEGFGTFVKVITPSGVHMMSRHSVVSFVI